MKRKLNLGILVLTAGLVLSACSEPAVTARETDGAHKSKPEAVVTEETEEDFTEPVTTETSEVPETTETTVSTEPSTVLYAEQFPEVPEEDRYLFLGGRCTGAFPDNSEIKRIALSKANQDNVWTVMYGVIDIEAKTVTYGTRNDSFRAEPEDYQVYELTDAEVADYRNAFRSDLLKDEIDPDKCYWRIAVEYKDGTVYSYQFGKEGYMNGAPENDMVNTFFNKIVVSDNFKFYYALHHIG